MYEKIRPLITKNFLSGILFLYSMFTSSLWGLDPGLAVTQYSVKAWTMDSGLPGNAVFCILQTREGNLWLGTQDGLVRFDGVNFELFHSQQQLALKIRNVRALYQDSDGGLWVGTHSNGLFHF